MTRIGLRIAAWCVVLGSCGIAFGQGAPERPDEPQAPAAQAQRGFEGRYRRGPEVAPVRIVLFTDYQCPDCDQLDQLLEGLIEGRPDVAVSVKHFPFSSMCNPNVARDMHPNACWAARAAEAAGMLRGSDGFWAMHRWLFSRRGSFTDAELRAALTGMGYDAAAFERVMTSPATLQAVQADIAEGMSVGLTGTPMLFINGREVQNWRVEGAVERAIAAAVETEPRTSAGDRPPTAVEKHIADWRSQPRAAVVDESARWLGRGGEGVVTVVVWGDMQEPNTAAADVEVRRLIEAGRPIRYAFRHFPVDQSCNAASPRTLHPAACAAARVREAAFLVGGEGAGWRAHVWLMRNAAAVKAAADGGKGAEGVARAVAAALGMDEGALVAALPRPEVGARIGADSALAGRMGVASIPMIFIDQRRVQRWTVGARPIIDEMVEAAVAERAGRP